MLLHEMFSHESLQYKPLISVTVFVSQVQELHEEEAQWVNYDEDELFVKMQLADSIFDALLTDTANVLTLIYDKRARTENPLSWQLSCLDFKLQPLAQPQSSPTLINSSQLPATLSSTSWCANSNPEMPSVPALPLS